MTILDLLKLIRRNLKLIIGLPAVCAFLAVVWALFAQASYTATASFVTNGDLALAQGIASNVSASYSNSDIKISCASVGASKQIMVNATGANSSACIQAANDVADEAVKKYKEASSNIIASVDEASYAVNNNPSVPRTAFVAFVAGLILAIFVIAVVDVVRAPIKSRNDVEIACNLPVIGDAPSPQGGEKLLANLQFRCDERPSTIAVVPVGTETTAPVVARELAGALERSDVRVKLVKGSPHAKKFQVSVPEDAAIVVSCEPLDAGMGAAYIAHNADATVLCVSEWTDSRRQLAATVQELELAKANIAGVAFLPEEKKSREPRRAKAPEGE